MKISASLISAAWRMFANICAISGISILIAWSLLLFMTPQSPVVIVSATEAARVKTPQVPYNGFLEYSYDSTRLQSCPGTAVLTFTSVTKAFPAVVTITRPVRSTEIRTYDDFPASIQLPESIFPGRWRFYSEVKSRCPTFERIDPLVSFEFEVTR